MLMIVMISDLLQNLFSTSSSIICISPPNPHTHKNNRALYREAERTNELRAHALNSTSVTKHTNEGKQNNTTMRKVRS